MKLVIDMPKEKYEWIKENNPNANPNSIVGAVAAGTPYEERPEGKWITHSDYPDRLICSNCNHRYDVWFIDKGTNYCPNCGADMRGET